MLYSVGVTTTHMNEYFLAFSGVCEQRLFIRKDEDDTSRDGSGGRGQENLLALLSGVLFNPGQRGEINWYLCLFMRCATSYFFFGDVGRLVRALGLFAEGVSGASCTSSATASVARVSP